MKRHLLLLCTLAIGCAGGGAASSLTISPPSAVVDLTAGADGRYTASTGFTASVGLADGSRRDVTGEVAWSIQSPATIAGGQATTGAAGQYTVQATSGGALATATLTARLQGSLYGPGRSSGDDPKLDGAATAPAPSIAYPIDGTLFPANLAPIQVHVAKSKSDQQLARLRFQAGTIVDARYYAACEPGPNDATGCYVTLPAALTSVFTFIGESSDVGLDARVAASDGSSLGESPPIALAWSSTPLTGGLYYWTTISPSAGAGTTGIARYDFAGDGSKPQIVYTDKGSPADHSDGNNCVGCHSITHDGTKMALTIGGSYPSDWMLLDVASLTRLALRNQGPEGFATETTFSPDGSRMVNMYRGELTIRGTDASLANQGPILGASVPEKKTDPFWSLDGRLFALVSWLPGQFGAPPASDLLGLDGDVKTGGQIWIAPSDGQTIQDQATPLVPRAPGITSYYPCISDDDALVVFNQSSCSGPSTNRGYGDGPCDGYADPSARLFLVAPGGGTPVALDRASGPSNSMSSWPRFSPDHGTFRGRRLYWIAFSSERAYGLQLNRAGSSLSPQLWFAAVTVPEGETFDAIDPSFAPAWLPGQNPNQAQPNGNHVPQWVSTAVPLQ
jgi:hypothetical protein